MKTKRFFIFMACCLLTLTLTGCSGGKDSISQAASRLGDDVSETVSRVGSALDSMMDGGESSGMPDEGDISSSPDYESSQGGGINSNDDSGITNGDESGTVSGNESALDGEDASSEASKLTKDL